MALSPVQMKPKTSGGKGGLFGKIAGGIIGGAAGAFAGNPMAGASLGAGVGGAIGQAADPMKQKGGAGVPLSTVAKQDPEVQMAQLMEAQKELMKSSKIPEPEKERANLEVFTPALEALRKRREIA